MGALLMMDHEVLSEMTDSIIQKVHTSIAHQHFRAPKPGNHILKYEAYNHLCSTILDMRCF